MKVSVNWRENCSYYSLKFLYVRFLRLSEIYIWEPLGGKKCGKTISKITDTNLKKLHSSLFCDHHDIAWYSRFYVLKKIFMYLLDIQRHQKTFITSPFDYLTQLGKRACMKKDVHASYRKMCPCPKFNVETNFSNRRVINKITKHT